MDHSNQHRQDGILAMRMDEYYKRFRARTIYTLFGIEFLVAVTTWGILYLVHTQIGLDNQLLLMAGVVVFLLLQLGATPFIVDIVTEPTKLIVEAITHVSKQVSSVTPPYVNQRRHEKSGLKNIVQTVYELAIGSSHELQVAAGEKENLAENTAFTKQLLNEIPCGIIALNKDRTVVYANKLAPVRVNVHQEQVIELLFEKNDSLDQWLDKCEKSKVRDSHVWARVANKIPDEKDRKIYDIIAYYQKEGSVADTMLVAIDKTAEYAPAQEDLDFIALAAHELRGPITVIKGYLDVLMVEMGDKMLADEKELFDRLNVSANRLSTYVNNILNVSRYDRRHLKLHLHETGVEQLFDSVIDDVAMRARTQNRILNIDIPAGLPTVAADHNSLSEVIVNLIDNAIKYSNEGSQVIVKAEIKGDFVEVSVQDFGIGIPGSVMGNLFTKFYRSHKSRQTVSGTGLGLYISKIIVESHGGKMWARSTEGQGSVFGFTLPVYATVADKLLAGDNRNQEIMESSSGWIKNHSMFRG
jgi:signal transduction histidine kinase